MGMMNETLRADLQNLFEGNIPCGYFRKKVFQRCSKRFCSACTFISKGALLNNNHPVMRVEHGYSKN